MEDLLFINPFFEEEILKTSDCLENYLLKHSVYLQLHYLSCILADEGSSSLVLYPPEEGYFARLEKSGIKAPTLVYLEDPLKKKYRLSSWGPSVLLEKWAKKNDCLYQIPSFDLIKKVNGKDFSFALGRTLPYAALLKSEEELLCWIRAVKGPKVLKTLYGSSGRGHLIFYKEEEKKALEFFQKEKKLSPFLIAECWVERVLDFSTQWEVGLEGTFSYLGATICENSKRGVYRKSIVGPVELLFKGREEFLKEHLIEAKKALEKMKEKGFFGPVGFDAMVYKDPKNLIVRLEPILEINARRTMGWVALRLYKKLGKKGLASFNYELKKKGKESFLPKYAKGPKNTIFLPGEFVIESL